MTGISCLVSHISVAYIYVCRRVTIFIITTLAIIFLFLLFGFSFSLSCYFLISFTMSIHFLVLDRALFVFLLATLSDQGMTVSIKKLSLSVYIVFIILTISQDSHE